MQMDDFVLVSADDHLVEPPDMFEGRIPDKYSKDVPKLVKREDGTDAWVPSPCWISRWSCPPPRLAARDFW